jgi:hypothetical protein
MAIRRNKRRINDIQGLIRHLQLYANKLDEGEIKPVDYKNIAEACKSFMEIIKERDEERQDKLLEQELQREDSNYPPDVTDFQELQRKAKEG